MKSSLMSDNPTPIIDHSKSPAAVQTTELDPNADSTRNLETSKSKHELVVPLLVDQHALKPLNAAAD